MGQFGSFGSGPVRFPSLILLTNRHSFLCYAIHAGKQTPTGNKATSLTGLHSVYFTVRLRIMDSVDVALTQTRFLSRVFTQRDILGIHWYTEVAATTNLPSK